MNNIFLIIVALFVIFYIIGSIRNDKLSVRNSFIWIVFCFIVLFLSINPKSLDWLSNMLGISYPPALFLTLSVIILYCMNFSYSRKIETLQKKIIDLGQELSILRDKNEK